MKNNYQPPVVIFDTLPRNDVLSVSTPEYRDDIFGSEIGGKSI